MKKYIKGNIIKKLSGILVGKLFEKNGEQYTKWVPAKTEEDVLNDGWQVYVNLEESKKDLLDTIEKYDKSENVNSFFIGDIQSWIDRDTRVSLMNSTTILKNINQETTTLWLNGNPYIINCELLIQLLSNLEIYALQCYNITEQHKSNVSKITTIEELESYDHTLNYPDKIKITL